MLDCICIHYALPVDSQNIACCRRMWWRHALFMQPPSRKRCVTQLWMCFFLNWAAWTAYVLCVHGIGRAVSFTPVLLRRNRNPTLNFDRISDVCCFLQITCSTAQPRFSSMRFLKSTSLCCRTAASSFLVLLAFLAAVPTTTESLRILGLFPHPGHSHFHFFHPIMRALAQHGHNVTVVSHFPDTNPVPGYKDLPLIGLPISTNSISLDVSALYEQIQHDPTYLQHAITVIYYITVVHKS